MQTNLPLAPISYVIALGFEPGFSKQLIALNHSLTQVYGPGSYALNDWWAPHLTLFQGGTDQQGIARLMDLLDRVMPRSINMELYFPRYACHQNGPLVLEAELTLELRELEQAIAEICASIHLANPLFRPRAIAKAPGLSKQGLGILMRTGSYKTGPLFSPHVSIAEFKGANPEEMLEHARSIFETPLVSVATSASFLDAGHENEKGNLIRQWNSPSN